MNPNKPGGIAVPISVATATLVTFLHDTFRKYTNVNERDLNTMASTTTLILEVVNSLNKHLPRAEAEALVDQGVQLAFDVMDSLCDDEDNGEGVKA